MYLQILRPYKGEGIIKQGDLPGLTATNQIAEALFSLQGLHSGPQGLFSFPKGFHAGSQACASFSTTTGLHSVLQGW